MVETEAAVDAVGVRQADIFQWTSTTDPAPFGIVVTADCDIAQEKFGRYLTYVPIISLREYLATYYLPDQILRQVSRTEIIIAEAIRKMQRTGRPDLSRALSDRSIIDWIENESIDDILALLNNTDPAAQHNLRQAVESRANLLAAGRSMEDDSAMIEAIALARGSKLKTIHKEIHDHITRLPGDKMYLSSIDGGHDASGFVVLVRHLREIQLGDIATRPVDLPQARAWRIARLQSPYKYRLTQQLAETFAAIGLPNEYEAARRDVLLSAYNLEISET